jgi:hypothetical protein
MALHICVVNLSDSLFINRFFIFLFFILDSGNLAPNKNIRQSKAKAMKGIRQSSDSDVQ